MSQLDVATVASKAAAIAPVFNDSAAREIGQLCTAWVNFNGTGTVAIRDSFNVSSITDNGVGIYTPNFANAMTNGNYTVALARHAVTTFANSVIQAYTPTLTGVKIQNYESGAVDSDYILATFFGGL